MTNAAASAALQSEGPREQLSAAALELPAGIHDSFALAAGELGMCTAAWLYAREVAAVGGRPLVAALREQLGRDFPVLDAVTAQFLDEIDAPTGDPAQVVTACAGITTLVIIGLETLHLDALVPRLEGVQVRLLTHSEMTADWERILSNYRGRVAATDLSDFQRFAGRRSALLTFAYGRHDQTLHVPAAWLRAVGDDTRTQFRSLIAWDVLRAPMFVYPRWLVSTPTSGFSHIVE